MVGVFLALGALQFAASLVAVEGRPCPSAEAVTQRLSALLPTDFDGGGRHARLSHEEDGLRLRVELRDPAGQQTAVRHLDAGGGCEGLADAVAVVLAAAWTVPGDGPFQGSSTDGPRVPMTWGEFAARKPRRLPPVPPIPVDVAISALVSFAGLDVAGGAALEVTAAPRGSRLGGRLGFFGTGLREEPLGPGRAAYTRLAFSLGPRYRLSRGRLFADLHVEGLVATVRVTGSGYSANAGSSDADLGLGGGLRAGFRFAAGDHRGAPRFAIVPFAGFGVAGWLRPQEVRVTGLLPTITLPQVEVLLVAGLAFGAFP